VSDAHRATYLLNLLGKRRDGWIQRGPLRGWRPQGRGGPNPPFRTIRLGHPLRTGLAHGEPTAHPAVALSCRWPSRMVRPERPIVSSRVEGRTQANPRVKVVRRGNARTALARSLAKVDLLFTPRRRLYGPHTSHRDGLPLVATAIRHSSFHAKRLQPTGGTPGWWAGGRSGGTLPETGLLDRRNAKIAQIVERRLVEGR
jgi:hypothetical protein